HRSFSTGRFDLGNMVQALWNTAEGRFLETTDVSGVQFNRLGAHVDLVLVLFTPLWWAWSSPEMLLVAQSLIVATGALPAFWLGRRWLGDDSLALAGAAVYLLFPALQHATLFDFHPVTLAAPLMLFCIWAIEERRDVVLGVCAALACLTQEQVGLVVAGLAVWMWVRHRDRRRAALILGAGALAWVAIAVGVIMPAFAIDGANPHLSRYAELGDTPGEILGTVLTRPWEALAVVATPGRLVHLAALLLPLLLLPLAAPLLAAAALPQLVINLFASSGPVQSVQYHYAVLLVPFLVAAALLGLAGLRRRERPERLARLLARPGLVAATLVAAVVIAGARQGPLPIWGWAPGGWSGSPLHAFSMDDQARALQRAVDTIPDDARVSAVNVAGAHLSERRRILLFPNRIGNAQYVLVADGERFRRMAQERPTLRPPGYRFAARRLSRSNRWELVFEEEEVRVYRRIPHPPIPAGLSGRAAG
ncbi:MAG TPA: DUF2079 domain-containing protein, partial [Miltoncostaeaceae bacterium]|nr:DUF2079 domain-containing protein [Miltoncostaeaceae bacterium]